MSKAFMDYVNAMLSVTDVFEKTFPTIPEQDTADHTSILTE
jgi:hypothetical protein